MEQSTCWCCLVSCPTIVTFKSRLTDITLTAVRLETSSIYRGFYRTTCTCFISLDSVISCSWHSYTATIYDNTQL